MADDRLECVNIPGEKADSTPLITTWKSTARYCAAGSYFLSLRIRLLPSLSRPRSRSARTYTGVMCVPKNNWPVSVALYTYRRYFLPPPSPLEHPHKLFATSFTFTPRIARGIVHSVRHAREDRVKFLSPIYSFYRETDDGIVISQVQPRHS